MPRHGNGREEGFSRSVRRRAGIFPRELWTTLWGIAGECPPGRANTGCQATCRGMGQIRANFFSLTSRLARGRPDYPPQLWTSLWGRRGKCSPGRMDAGCQAVCCGIGQLDNKLFWLGGIADAVGFRPRCARAVAGLADLQRQAEQGPHFPAPRASDSGLDGLRPRAVQAGVRCTRRRSDRPLPSLSAPRRSPTPRPRNGAGKSRHPIATRAAIKASRKTSSDPT